jgi:hypothetical protein
VWLFREKLIQLLPLLHVKGGGWEASFRLDQAEKEAAALPPAPVEPESQPTPEEKSKFEQIAEISPRAAILEARTDVEEAVRTLARAAKLLTPKVQSFLGITRLLRSREVIDSNTSALLDDLRTIGNSAAHSANAEFTPDDARRFRTLANNIINRLRLAEMLM